MELKMLKEKTRSFFSKYRYMILLVIVGVVLLLLPTSNRQTEIEPVSTVPEVSSKPELSDQLEDILCQIDGAGEVRVLLSIASGEERIYQTDSDQSHSGDLQHIQNDTVVITDSERSQNGLIRRIDPPMYSGAVVICKGADNPSVQLAIVNAVSKLTGLGADRISVLKMK